MPSNLSSAPIADSRKDTLEEIFVLLRNHNMQGFILPKTDAHRSEYGGLRDNLVWFLSGFSGSTGFAAVSLPAQKGAVFVDGRYTLQVQQEVDSALFDYENYGLKDITAWFSHSLKTGDRIGYDPLLLSKAEYDRYRAAFAAQGFSLDPLAAGTLEALWRDRPSLEIPAIVPHPLVYTGISHEQKIALIQDRLKDQKVDGLFLNYSESSAWLFNIRAPERLGTPAASVYAYIPVTGTTHLFIHERQKTPELSTYFQDHVILASYDHVFTTVASLAAGKVVLLDPSQATMAMVTAIGSQGGKVLEGEDFCALPRACKNETERRGMVHAHIRDGVAICDFLAGLAGQDLSHEPVTELDVVERLYQERQRQALFQGYSFETIAGSGPNGAIVHYRVDEKSNRRLLPTDIFLLDSGGQYLDGTTDVTRTISLNQQPSLEQKDRYTRVLKGHIALAQAVFPEGTTGSQLDSLARYALWQIGCDYAHGTGHGVGSYLGVHEGPQGISSRPNTVALQEGMILSNEPGYYKQGAYGIRIESLIMVKRFPKKRTQDDQQMLCFETLTQVPLDTALMDLPLLTSEEIQWINAYHAKVALTLIPLVKAETKEWLDKATQPLTR